MSVVRLMGKVNAAGQLVVDLPWVPKEPEVEVMVEEPVRSPEERLRRIEEAFGSMPDLVRPPQGEMPPPLTW